MNTYVGAEVDRLPNARLAKTLELVIFAPRAPLPKPSTLRKWRADVSAELETMLIVPRAQLVTQQGSLRLELMADALDWTRAAADALRAKAIVVQTPSDIAPGARDRQRIARYFEALREGAPRRIIWAPLGVWEHEEAKRFAKTLDCTLAFDPLEDDAPEGQHVFARLRTIGVRPRLSSSSLEEAALRLASIDAEEIIVSIASETAVRDAKRMREVLDGVEATLEAMEDDEETDDDDLEDEDTDDEDLDEDEDEDTDDDLDDD